jgi:signal transduction histidine kinase
MFARARRRLAVRYLVLFALVLIAFSIVFFAVLAVVLQPAFDIAPELPNQEAARHAYARSIERIALALALADLLVLVLIGIVGYYLAGRTLRPIREAHERQRRFVADASHEMRGPLTAIRSTAEAALRPDKPRSAERDALETILTTSARLGQLTTDLLVLARTENGFLAKPAEEIDLSVAVAESIERSGRADAEREPPTIQLAPDVIVRADPDDVSTIVANLLDNAWRYGAKPIQVRTGANDDIGFVDVVDHGPGIAAADAERVFDPFYRVRADAASPPGSGLGLAIASELAGRHGGRLRLVSRPGSGATFRLELPRAR